ncbi:MAG: MG2 domain-containing protein [Prolixibacteraceae bacterium]|nr:MG2 domain-containing protein [Prolixibacteraceae bacterium]
MELIGNGVIVPDQGKLLFPFEAVSLNAVDLRIIKIHASNIRQFLQDNQFTGSSDLTKVGRLIYSGKVELKPDKPEKLHQWETYKVNLEDYVAIEQGAIYRIELRFSPQYSLYNCSGEEGDLNFRGWQSNDTDWDGPGWYSSYSYPSGYDWYERNNPCHVSFYNYSRFVSRNIYASNLGIIAKEGKGYKFSFVVSNISTTIPESRAEVALFDYQHQPMGKTFTDANGIAHIQLERKPYIAVVTKGNQIGYLRLDDGSSLSLSNFNILGETVQEGVKGFLYGERGVWRPGDKLLLTFILDDPTDRFPANTPVIFKLINARGQEVNRQVATSSENGFYHFPVSTHPDDPTGNWTAEVQVGGATFSNRIKIETVKPNRLKIDLKLPEIIKHSERQTATLTSGWLHGAPSPYLETQVEVELFSMKTVFKGYEKFTFDNPTVAYYPSKITIFDSRLDEKSRADIPLDFEIEENVDGKMRAWFTTRVYETGGEFSINMQSAEYAPFNKFIGMKMQEIESSWYKTDTNYEVELVSLNPEGAPTPMNNIEVSLYKVGWRWWWESGDDQLAQYVSGSHYSPVKTWHVSGDSKQKITLNVTYNSWDDTGRYFLYARDTNTGNAAGLTFFMSRWGGWQSDMFPDGATLLALTTDKEKYSIGDKIKVKIPSSKNGRALVSLEDGKEVKEIYWVETSENETVFDVQVKEGMAPTLYIHVSLIQPYGTTENDAPIRMYGVVGVDVEDSKTILKPEISMSDELEPNKEFSVKIKEKDGRPMTYTIAIVDEGLLDLTNFKTPDPHKSFYVREALGVKTYDLYNFVAGAYGARMEKAFAVGGDGDMANQGKKQANRFEPVVMYAGPFTLQKGSQTHSFKMPNYVGSVRAMVIAGNQGAYGNTSKDVKVRMPVMVLATLPRMASPNEEMDLPVTVFAMQDKVKNVSVEVETNDLFSVAGGKSQNISFNEIGDKVIYFKLKTSAKTGIGTVKITAKSGKETATYNIEIDVRNPNLSVTVEKSKFIAAGQPWEAELSVPGFDETSEAYVELSTFPGLNLEKNLQYLIQYPHGCVEQTTSGAFAQLFLDKLIKLTPKEKTRTEENVRAGLQRLNTMQISNGGLSYWPGQNYANNWGTCYGGHFMMLAEQKGYTLPSGLKRKWVSYQKSAARAWKMPAGNSESYVSSDETLTQAYRLYTLALAGEPEQGLMNKLREEVGNYPQAKWRLAAAYALTGQLAAAQQLIGTTIPESQKYDYYGETFGSSLRDRAMILETLILLKENEKAFPLLREMATEVNKMEWLSTQTAAWIFYAMSRFFENSTGSGNIDVTVSGSIEKERFRSDMPILKVPVKIDKNGNTKATVENNGSIELFTRLVARGIPFEDNLEPESKNLKISVYYSDDIGGQNEINPASLKQSTDLYMFVQVVNTGHRTYQNLALSTVFPSGWEILNRRLGDIPENEAKMFEYQDIRDDRVYTYFSLSAGKSRTFRIDLNASYKGHFYMPPVICEDMYDNSIYARTKSMWVDVIDAE